MLFTIVDLTFSWRYDLSRALVLSLSLSLSLKRTSICAHSERTPDPYTRKARKRRG